MTIDITTTITAVSIAINAAFTWAWYRRKEIVKLVRKARAYYNDDSKTEDEFFEVMDELNAVMEKK